MLAPRTTNKTHTDDANSGDVSDGATTSASEGTSEPSLTSLSSLRVVVGKRPAPPRAPPLKRKATYYQRKDEIDALEKQVKTLQATLRDVRQHSMVAAREAIAKLDPQTLRAFHDETITRNNLKLAGTQALLSSYNQTLSAKSELVPLKTYVHLPVNLDERSKILSALRETKLRSALEFMTERTRGLNVAVAQSQTERFDYRNGDFAATGFAISLVDSGHSLRQVFDAFMFFVRNQEISISEELGVLTIRDSADEFQCGQSRFLSSLPEGLEIEFNAVMCARILERTPTERGYAVGTIDFVDQDDLHPYRPHECARKEITGAMFMTEVPGPAGSNGRPTVALSWWFHEIIRAPTTPMDEPTVKAARASIAKWHEVATKVVHDRLAVVPPQP